MALEKTYQQLKTSLRKYRKILIYIKGSPDPDAIASSFLLKTICQKLHVEAAIVATTVLSLEANKEFVRRLNIPFRFEKSLRHEETYDAYAVVDHQSAHVEHLTGKIPCAVHIDHHEIVDEEIEVDFKVIDLEAGSTSTIMTSLMQEADFPLNHAERKNLCTALLFGIKTDTDQFIHATERDNLAIEHLTKQADHELISRLSALVYSKISKEMLAIANENQYLYKDWLITGIGFIEQRNRDIIAIIADYLLKKEKISAIIVFAAVTDNDQRLALDASFRTNDSRIDLNAIIKEITDQGGGRRYKGAFQVNLDFFSHCPDRDLLWDVIRLTVIDVLVKRRDKIYVTEFKGLYHKIKHRITRLIKYKTTIKI